MKEADEILVAEQDKGSIKSVKIATVPYNAVRPTDCQGAEEAEHATEKLISIQEVTNSRANLCQRARDVAAAVRLYR